MRCDGEGTRERSRRSLLLYFTDFSRFLGTCEGLISLVCIIVQLSLLCIFRDDLVGIKLECHGLNFFCLQREVAVKTSGANGWFAQVYSGSRVLQKAQVLNFCTPRSASTLHLRCVSPHAGQCAILWYTNLQLQSAREKTEAGIPIVPSQRLPCKTHL